MSSSFVLCTDGVHDVCIPASLDVKSPLPNLLARKKDGTAIWITIAPDETQWETIRRMLRNPPPRNPLMITDIVRSGAMNHPFDGEEAIHRGTVVATGRTTWHWLIAGTLNGKRITIKIDDSGDFAAKEALWTKVLSSLKV